MVQKAIRYMRYAQTSFLLCCVWCLAVNPQALQASSGISFYGNYLATFAPYAIGLSLAAVFLWLSARILRDVHGRHALVVRQTMFWSAMALVGIIITPSFSVLPIRTLHFGFGIILFAAQLRMSWQLIAGRVPVRTEHIILAMQVAALAAIILSWRRIGVLHLMIPAQITAVIAACSIAVRTLSYKTRRLSARDDYVEATTEKSGMPPAITDEELLAERP